MPDSYSPLYVEAAWYSWWEKSGFFKPEYGVSRDINSPNNSLQCFICLHLLLSSSFQNSNSILQTPEIVSYCNVHFLFFFLKPSSGRRQNLAVDLQLHIRHCSTVVGTICRLSSALFLFFHHH